MPLLCGSHPRARKAPRHLPLQRKPPNSPHTPGFRTIAPCAWGWHLLLSLGLGTGTHLAAHSKPQARPTPSSTWTTDLPHTQLHSKTAKTRGQKPGFLSTAPKKSRTRLLALPGMFPDKRVSGEEATPLQPQRRLCVSHCLSSSTGRAGGVPTSFESVDILNTFTE